MKKIPCVRFFIGACSILWCIFLPFSISAQAKNTIVIGALHVPPYIIISTDDNKVAGIVPEMLDAIFLPLGITVKYELLSIPRIKRALKTGEIDAFPLIFTGQRKASLVVGTDVYLTANDYIWAQKAQYLTAIPWHKYDDLKGYRFGIVSHVSYGKETNDFIASNPENFYASTTTEQSIKLLLAGRVDGIFNSEYIMKNYIERNNLATQLVRSQKALFQNKYVIGISKKSPFANQLAKINQQIKQINTRQ